MTSTSAHSEHNKEVEKKVEKELLKIPQILDFSNNEFRIDVGNKIVTYAFHWELFPAYAHNQYDEGYKNYWYVLLKNKEELKKGWKASKKLVDLNDKTGLLS